MFERIHRDSLRIDITLLTEKPEFYLLREKEIIS